MRSESVSYTHLDVYKRQQPALRRWVKLSTEPEDSVDKRIAELEAENKALKKDLSDAKDTVEVLKKSVAIFIKP